MPPYMNTTLNPAQLRRHSESLWISAQLWNNLWSLIVSASSCLIIFSHIWTQTWIPVQLRRNYGSLAVSHIWTQTWIPVQLRRNSGALAMSHIWTQTLSKSISLESAVQIWYVQKHVLVAKNISFESVVQSCVHIWGRIIMHVMALSDS